MPDENRGLSVYRPQSSFVASRAPSAMALSFAQHTEGVAVRFPRPQSVPAMTFSRPTSFA